jgi:tRNA/tmRNA/rRNA uracil-C5-methylase (TrmA/RlmC/RlmD family)
MKVATIGLEIAKQVFQVHGADRTGQTVAEAEAKAQRGGSFLFCAGAMPRRHRSQWELALLGASAECIWRALQ